MELTTVETPAKTIKSLEFNGPVVAAQRVKFEIGEDELDTAVPAGKRWMVWAKVQIIETDA